MCNVTHSIIAAYYFGGRGGAGFDGGRGNGGCGGDGPRGGWGLSITTSDAGMRLSPSFGIGTSTGRSSTACIRSSYVRSCCPLDPRHHGNQLPSPGVAGAANQTRGRFTPGILLTPLAGEFGFAC